MTEEKRETARGAVVEHVAVALLAVTAVLTAWSGFEASKWSGEMSISFSRASTQRIEASREATTAEAARAVDLQVFGIWLEATSESDRELEEFAPRAVHRPLRGGLRGLARDASAAEPGRAAQPVRHGQLRAAR